MPNTIKVVIVNGDNNVRKLISDTIASINDMLVVGETDSSDKGMQMVEDLKPDVILIGDFIRGTDGFQFSDSITAGHPFHSIVLVTSAIGEDVYRLSMRSGIREILHYPFNQVALSDAIYRSYDIKEKHSTTILQTRKRNESSIREKSGKIISVFSTKGGVGKTTISSNLAVLLKQSSKKVALSTLIYIQEM